jgi:hypothetical protein
MGNIRNKYEMLKKEEQKLENSESAANLQNI